MTSVKKFILSSVASVLLAMACVFACYVVVGSPLETANIVTDKYAVEYSCEWRVDRLDNGPTVDVEVCTPQTNWLQVNGAWIVVLPSTYDTINVGDTWNG